MKTFSRIMPLLVCGLLVCSQAVAQPPEGKPEGPNQDRPKDFSNSPLVTRMMGFNKKGDGKLTKDEVTDPRLLRLFEQADANHDGVVTKEELTSLAAKMSAESGGERGGRRLGGPGAHRGPEGRGGPQGPGGPNDQAGPGGPEGQGPGDRGPEGRRRPEPRGPQGPGGPNDQAGPGGQAPGGRGGQGRGRGMPPRPGKVLSERDQEALKLSPEQKTQIEQLQKEVNLTLEKILTEEQQKQLQAMGDHGPGGAGGPEGFGPPPMGPKGPPPEEN